MKHQHFWVNSGPILYCVFFYCWLAFVFSENLCVAEVLWSDCLQSLEEGVLLPLALPAKINCSQLETRGFRMRPHFYSSTQMELSNKN